MEESELRALIEQVKGGQDIGVDDETIGSELSVYIDQYRLDVQSAVSAVKKKHAARGAAPAATAANASKKIVDLNGTEQSVDVIAKVVYVEVKSITPKKGATVGFSKNIISGILGDDTGTASFTVWEPGAVSLEKGRVYHFRNCYCKTWNDKVQINIGNRGRIEAADDIELDVPENVSSYTPVEVKIGDIRDGMGSVTVTGKILSVEARRVVSRGEEKVVYSGLIADETGKIQYSAWHDLDLAEGQVINARNCYIRAWKGIPQLNIGDRAVVEKLNTEIEVGGGETLRTVADINRVGGGLDLTVEGVIVDVKGGSGLIKRCPQCNRSLLNGVCTVHGEVEGRQDMRLKIVVDDGTGAIGAVVNRELTEKISGVSMNAAVGLAKAKGEGVVVRELMGRVLLRRVRITGNVMCDDYGPNMMVHEADSVEVDIEGDARKLLEEVEAAL